MMNRPIVEEVVGKRLLVCLVISNLNQNYSIGNFDDPASILSKILGVLQEPFDGGLIFNGTRVSVQFSRTVRSSHIVVDIA